MRLVRSTGAVALVVTALAVGSAATSAAEVPVTAGSRPLPTGLIAHVVAGPVQPGELVELAIESLVAGRRVADPRVGPVWACAGVGAALVAFCLGRRLRTGRPAPAPRLLLLGSVSGRAPPGDPRV
jgi:hypothetical protein